MPSILLFGFRRDKQVDFFDFNVAQKEKDSIMLARTHDFIPRPDAQFDAYFKNVVRYVDENNAAWGHIPLCDIEGLGEQYVLWRNAYLPTLAPHIEPLTKEKNRVRVEVERTLRAFINRFLRGQPVSDIDRDKMGIRNLDAASTKHPAPKAVPEIETNTSVIRRLIMRLGASHRGKPNHVHGMELAWGVMDASPADVSQLPNLESATANPIELVFEERKRGKRVFFAARWVSNTAGTGPWSEIESAAIP